MSAPSLLELYHTSSKHSHYQTLPAQLQVLLRQGDLDVKSRYEEQRLAYIRSHLDVRDLHVADIGGNTGFFSFEMLGLGARSVDYYEGNAAHHDFVRAAALQLGLDGALRTHHEYVEFEPDALPHADCTVLLNVLHHLGDDFGDQALARDAAKERILACLCALARSTRTLVFQLGFNWKGDRHSPLFERGTRTEMIEFIALGTSCDWTITSIGVAERGAEGIVFNEVHQGNISRDDSLGEFLNRPIFIMQSRHEPRA